MLNPKKTVQEWGWGPYLLAWLLFIGIGFAGGLASSSILLDGPLLRPNYVDHETRAQELQIELALAEVELSRLQSGLQEHPFDILLQSYDPQEIGGELIDAFPALTGYAVVQQPAGGLACVIVMAIYVVDVDPEWAIIGDC